VGVSIAPSTVELVRFDAASLPGLRRLVEDPEVVRFTRIPEPVPADFAERWLERYEVGRRDGTKGAFAVVDRASGNFLWVAASRPKRSSCSPLGRSTSSTRCGSSC
jgi:hypothetical protein